MPPFRLPPHAMRLMTLLTSSFAVVGCGPSPTAVHPVTGKVVVDGKPALGVQVAFVPLTKPADIDVNPTAATTKDGTFKLTTRAKDDGAPAGNYKVLLAWTVQDGPAEDPRFRKLLPGQYANSDATPLKAAVQAGPNELPVFEIKMRK